jgi:hypothetical protein
MVMRPIRLLPFSANHNAPSAAAAIPYGLLSVGRGIGPPTIRGDPPDPADEAFGKPQRAGLPAQAIQFSHAELAVLLQSD